MAFLFTWKLSCLPSNRFSHHNLPVGPARFGMCVLSPSGKLTHVREEQVQVRMREMCVSTINYVIPCDEFHLGGGRDCLATPLYQ